MDWINAVDDIFQKYSGQGGGTAAAPADPHQDFQRVAQAAPQNVVASGIAQALRSEKTPPFPQMLASLFGQSDPNQRAGLLNRLLGSLGPEAAGMLQGLQPGNVTPEQAQQVSPEKVQQIAERAQSRNPSVVDEVSSFYAQHPQVVKAAGGLALAVALQHILKR